MPWGRREHLATRVCYPVYIPAVKSQMKKMQKTKLQRVDGNYSRDTPESGDMSTTWKSSLSRWGRNLRIQTSCHNIQIKLCLRQLLCDPELRSSYTAGCFVREASATVAQLKPVKQDKSWLCQACTLQSTAEMTIAEDSAHAAGIYLKKMTDNILSDPVH